MGSLTPKATWYCGFREGAVALGWIHNLAQENAAPREVVKDHDDEGLVEAEGQRPGCLEQGDAHGGSCLHALLIELQHRLVNHLLGTDQRWWVSTSCVLGAFHTWLLRILSPLALWMAKLRLREGYLLAPHLSGSPRTRAKACPPPELGLYQGFLPRKRAGGTRCLEIMDLLVRTALQCLCRELLPGFWAEGIPRSLSTLLGKY